MGKNQGYGRKEWKVLDGLRYKWDSKHTSKSAAQTRAKNLRKHHKGAKARVIKQSKYYVVYKRKT